MTTSTNGSATATVATLTAEVHVLQVGNRQITMSVYNQLDHAGLGEIEWPPFGRVHPRSVDRHTLYLVGRHEHTGALVRSQLIDPSQIAATYRKRDYARNDPGRFTGPGRVAGSLVEYAYEPAWHNCGWADETWATALETWAQLADLPLIVLAGLR